jgi:uncharacterized protein (TIGR03437 family)
MGVNWRQLFVLCFLCVSVVSAAPKLRLSTASVGPVTIAVNANGPLQVLDAANIGDGNLALSLSSSATWLVPTVGAARSCLLSPSGTCTAIQLALNTAALAKGRYTAIATINDPNAIDAPQTISVTVQIGGGVPDSVQFFVPPGGSTNVSFTTSNRITTNVTNPAGGPTLALSNTGGGSFDFNFTYMLTASAPVSTPENQFQGSFAVTSSAFAGDVKTVPVTVRVTSQPIASVAPGSVRFRIAQGALKQDKWIIASNLGRGALTISSANATTSSGGDWLKTAVNGSIVVASAESGSLAPGTYQGQVAIASNAANGTVNVPVTLEVLASGRPIIFFRGVQDNALFESAGDTTGGMPQGGIVALKGEQFTTGAQILKETPAANTLGGATVFVNDRVAPLYFITGSHVINDGGQINFQIPYDTPIGDATVRVDRDGVRGNTVSTRIVSSAPRILPLANGYGIVTVTDPNGFSFVMPPTPGINSRRAKIGEAITIWCFGLGPTNPVVTAGQPAPGVEPFARVADTVNITIGGSILPGTGRVIEAAFAGLTPFIFGVYQVSIVLPEGTPTGDAVHLHLTVGNVVSNSLIIALE